MERESGNSAVEKERLRGQIQAQVRRYLERGGQITVIENCKGSPGKNAQAGGGVVDQTLFPDLD